MRRRVFVYIYVGGDGRAVLLVVFGVAVVGDVGYVVFVGILVGGLVIGFVSGVYGVVIIGCIEYIIGGLEGAEKLVYIF